MTRDEFLLDETRDGLFISSKIKKARDKQIQILIVFDKFCKENNIKYFAGFGTLLGAVRHKGFIPRDDDIDVVMLREDYDKLISLGHLFEKPYFLQSNYTDTIDRGHAELRDSSTTCFMTCDYKQKYNRGILIDIFALDCVRESNKIDFLNMLQEEYKHLYIYPQRMFGRSHPALALFYNFFIYNFKVILFHIFGSHKRRKKEFKNFELLCQKYNNTDFDDLKCGPVEYRASMNLKDYNYYDINDFSDTIYLDFEYIKVPCPINFDEYLKSNYGDYLVPKKGTQRHSQMFFDVDHDYSYYDKRIKNIRDFDQLFKKVD